MQLLKFSFAAIALFRVLAACSAGTHEAANGAAIYRQYCIACHGADGKLGLNGAGDLTKSTLSLNDRITQIAKGKNMMAPFEEVLTPAEIKAVAEYTIKLKKK